MTKKDFRKKYLALRNSIPPSQKTVYDKALTGKILSLSEFQNAESVLLFASIGSEFSTRELFEECTRRGKGVYFPKCIDDKVIEFYRVGEISNLKSGKFGISEPTGTEKYSSQNAYDLAVIPALSVGKDFSRLGYGKGYYDRFLKDFNGISLCPIYSELLCDGVPTDEFDIPQNIIITPNEFFRR